MMGRPDDDFLLGGGNGFCRQMEEGFDAWVAGGDGVDAFVPGMLLCHVLVVVGLAIFSPDVIVEGVVIEQLECQTATDEIRHIDGEDIEEVGDVIPVVDESAVGVGIEKDVGLQIAQVDVGVACFIVGFHDAAAFFLKIGIAGIEVFKHVLASVVDYGTDEDEGLESGMSLHELIDLVVFPFCFEQSEKDASDGGLVFEFFQCLGLKSLCVFHLLPSEAELFRLT